MVHKIKKAYGYKYELSKILGIEGKVDLESDRRKFSEVFTYNKYF